MGYCMELQSQNFFIAKENAEKALEALKESAMKHISNPNPDYHDFGWVNAQKVTSSETFDKAMRERRWPVFENDNGDFDTIEFNGEKLADDLKFFTVIAPFVKSDSFIEMNGEDGTIWKWIFKDEKVSEKTAKIVYEYED